MKRIFVLLLLLSIFLRSFGQLDVNKTIVVDGVQRQYSLHLPLSFRSSKKIRLIFAFHGDETDYKGAVKLYNLNDLADEQHFIIVYPSALGRHWNIPWMKSKDSTSTADADDSDNADDLQFISNLIDTLALNYKEDTAHIFATGIGRGGIFAVYLASKLPNRIRAIAPVCTSIPKSFAADFSFPRPIPVLLINGTTDPFLNYNGGRRTMNQPGGGKNIDMLSTEDFVDKLAKTDSCDIDPAVSDVPRNKNGGDECSAVETIYTCKVTIDFLAIINGGHTWPGRYDYLPRIYEGKVCRDFNAEDRIISFFKSVN